jgi:hypothetical protein
MSQNRTLTMDRNVFFYLVRHFGEREALNVYTQCAKVGLRLDFEEVLDFDAAITAQLANIQGDQLINEPQRGDQLPFDPFLSDGANRYLNQLYQAPTAASQVSTSNTQGSELVARYAEPRRADPRPPHTFTTDEANRDLNQFSRGPTVVLPTSSSNTQENQFVTGNTAVPRENTRTINANVGANRYLNQPYQRLADICPVGPVMTDFTGFSTRRRIPTQGVANTDLGITAPTDPVKTEATSDKTVDLVEKEIAGRQDEEKMDIVKDEDTAAEKIDPVRKTAADHQAQSSDVTMTDVKAESPPNVRIDPSSTFHQSESSLDRAERVDWLAQRLYDAVKSDNAYIDTSDDESEANNFQDDHPQLVRENVTAGSGIGPSTGLAPPLVPLWRMSQVALARQIETTTDPEERRRLEEYHAARRE